MARSLSYTFGWFESVKSSLVGDFARYENSVYKAAQAPSKKAVYSGGRIYSDPSCMAVVSDQAEPLLSVLNPVRRIRASIKRLGQYQAH